MTRLVPTLRLNAANTQPVRPDGDYVVYWMTSARRTHWNYGLERALGYAERYHKPLVVFEALRAGYQWASDRHHLFVLDGMVDNAERLRAAGITYYPYVEPTPGASAGLLERLAARAVVVVTDEFPCFFLPKMIAAAARKVSVFLETVDSNGLLPLRSHPQAFPTAYVFRRHVQKTIGAHLLDVPSADPLAGVTLPAGAVPQDVLDRFPPASAALLAGDRVALAALPIDHGVRPVSYRGGPVAAALALERFVTRALHRYGTDRNEPSADATSGLSPYLHFGHISAHAIFDAVMRHEGWSPTQLGAKANGQREGFWGVSAEAEGFLDQLITWRELGYGFAFHRPDYDKYASLPDWARATLDGHASDRRPHLYTLAELDEGDTHDPIWNAAQAQLRVDGRIHNYLRMLWGKKILEWSPSPEAAVDALIELNNRYSVDGRNPNSYSGLFWTLGRFDRPWAPERPIFGVIRYMSSENTRRKLDVTRYIERWSD